MSNQFQLSTFLTNYACSNLPIQLVRKIAKCIRLRKHQPYMSYLNCPLFSDTIVSSLNDFVYTYKKYQDQHQKNILFTPAMLRAITKSTNNTLICKLVYGCASELPEREKMNYDVVIVGGGIAGLATAIKLKQEEQTYKRPISVCLIEKSRDVGNHILSGNCFEPRALDELFPGWRNFSENPVPIDTKVSTDEFMILLNDKHSIKVPHFLHPKTIDNHSNYLISLGKLCGWLSERATDMGVDIFTGTSAAEILYNQKGEVRGIATGDTGIGKNGQPKDNYQRGIQIEARQTVLAEGARGSLSEKIIAKYNLRKDKDPQIYGIGIKQVWEVSQDKSKPGKVQHTVGWPLPSDVYGGSFIYHMKPNRIHIGMVVGLDYQNPYLNPYEEFQRLKTHPAIRSQLEGGECVSYGARALNEGGYFSIPKLVFPGGVLVGCSAGFLNVMKIKGAHNAMKSGMVAASAIYNRISNTPQEQTLTVEEYEADMKKSWVWEELHMTRNFKNSFKNLYLGLAYSGLFKLLGGKEPWDVRKNKLDSKAIKPASEFKHDRKLTFDLLENLARSGTNHQHDQPSHLVVKPGLEQSPLKSLNVYAGMEERFCPAKVYEFVEDPEGKGKKLQINAQNCLHCKTCSIKMIDEYIDWRTPQGQGGPQYNGM